MFVCLQELTRVEHGNPLVELVVVGHGVELTALHLSKGRFALLTGFGVTRPIALPFSGAVLASKLWSAEKTQNFDSLSTFKRETAKEKRKT